MAGEKPTSGYVLSLIGGVFVIIGGACIIVISVSLEAPFGLPNYSYFICGPIGILMGLAMIVAASYSYHNPELGPKLGSVIVILSIASWVVAVGGLIIGSLLGFIGGILLIAWKPPKEISPQIPMERIIIREREIVRFPCQYCAQLVDVGTVKCPYCGASPR